MSDGYRRLKSSLYLATPATARPASVKVFYAGAKVFYAGALRRQGKCETYGTLTNPRPPKANEKQMGSHTWRKGSAHADGAVAADPLRLIASRTRHPFEAIEYPILPS